MIVIYSVEPPENLEKKIVCEVYISPYCHLALVVYEVNSLT